MNGKGAEKWSGYINAKKVKGCKGKKKAGENTAK